MKAGAKTGITRAASAALDTLRSIHFFEHLRAALRGLGLAGKEETMGVGAFFVAASRFQPYPLRLEIQERTEGTAEYIVDKVATLLPQDTVVTIRPAEDEEWARLKESPDDKVVFIPEWETNTTTDDSLLEVQRNRLTLRIPVRTKERVEERIEVIEGRFACISVKRPYVPGWHPRWLTMRQPEGQQKAKGVTSAPNRADIEMWHQVQRLLQERARLPILLPEWEQFVVEEMGQRDERALRHFPAALQLWRTMSLIQSFQSPANDSARSLLGTFEDLAAAMLLGRKVFRQASWFPSAQRIYDKLGRSSRTGVINPATGKVALYQPRVEEARKQYPDPLYWDEV